MRPSVGRIVHYQSYGTPGGEYLAQPRAAIITAVDPFDEERGDEEAVVDLCVLNPEGMFFNRHVYFADPPIGGHWSWPPRVEG